MGSGAGGKAKSARSVDENLYSWIEFFVVVVFSGLAAGRCNLPLTIKNQKKNSRCPPLGVD